MYIPIYIISVYIYVCIYSKYHMGMILGMYIYSRMISHLQCLNIYYKFYCRSYREERGERAACAEPRVLDKREWRRRMVGRRCPAALYWITWKETG